MMLVLHHMLCGFWGFHLHDLTFSSDPSKTGIYTYIKVPFITLVTIVRIRYLTGIAPFVKNLSLNVSMGIPFVHEFL